MDKNHINRNTFGDTIKDDEKLQQQIDELTKARKDVINPYSKKMGNCEIIPLGGDHLIYEQKPKECGEIIKVFVDGSDS